MHTLPARPRDVADDGELHYAVLGPHAASEAGRPSAEARRFIEQTTAADRDRVYRNAIVLVVPSRDGLDAARTRVREYVGWEEVGAQLQEQPIDPLREQMLATETAAATICGARMSNRDASRIWQARSRSLRSRRRCCGRKRYSTRS